MATRPWFGDYDAKQLDAFSEKVVSQSAPTAYCRLAQETFASFQPADLRAEVEKSLKEFQRGLAYRVLTKEGPPPKALKARADLDAALSKTSFHHSSVTEFIEQYSSSFLAEAQKVWRSGAAAGR